MFFNSTFRFYLKVLVKTYGNTLANPPFFSLMLLRNPVSSKTVHTQKYAKNRRSILWTFSVQDFEGFDITFTMSVAEFSIWLSRFRDTGI